MIIALISLFALLSYSAGVRSLFKGEYKPSIYSRAIWFLIATNSFLSVVFLKNDAGSLTLAGIQALGCLVMLIGAFKYSVHTFGKTEAVCTLLLGSSTILWLTVNNPTLNLALGLTAHFIGAVPSLLAVLKRPESEHFYFWLFFLIASILAYYQADKSVAKNFLYALYFTIFDGTMTILAARQFRKS